MVVWVDETGMVGVRGKGGRSNRERRRGHQIPWSRERNGQFVREERPNGLIQYLR